MTEVIKYCTALTATWHWGVEWAGKHSSLQGSLSEGDSPQWMFSIFQPHPRGPLPKRQILAHMVSVVPLNVVNFCLHYNKRNNTKDWHKWLRIKYSWPAWPPPSGQGSNLLFCSQIYYLDPAPVTRTPCCHYGKGITVLNVPSYLGWFCRKV